MLSSDLGLPPGELGDPLFEFESSFVSFLLESLPLFGFVECLLVSLSDDVFCSFESSLFEVSLPICGIAFPELWSFLLSEGLVLSPSF